jgi:ATP/ADP translocase
MNTTKHALFLITSREEKYKAKAATDTFFHRSGDVLSTFLVLICATFFAIDITNISIIAKINVVIAVIFILLGVLIAREHKRRSHHLAKPKA